MDGSIDIRAKYHSSHPSLLLDVTRWRSRAHTRISPRLLLTYFGARSICSNSSDIFNSNIFAAVFHLILFFGQNLIISCCQENKSSDLMRFMMKFLFRSFVIVRSRILNEQSQKIQEKIISVSSKFIKLNFCCADKRIFPFLFHFCFDQHKMIEFTSVHRNDILSVIQISTETPTSKRIKNKSTKNKK